VLSLRVAVSIKGDGYGFTWATSCSHKRFDGTTPFVPVLVLITCLI